MDLRETMGLAEAQVLPSLALGRQRFPMAAHGLQQVKGAIHVAGDVDAVR
jgi:hypothetical protein